jgi:hypothetical protein
MVWWLFLVPWIVLPHWAAVADRRGWAWPGTRADFRKTILAGFLFLVAVFGSQAAVWAKTSRPRSLDKAVSAGTPWDIAAALRNPAAGPTDRTKELAKVLRERYGGKFTGRVFASEMQGDYLIWALPADIPELMYTHAHVFPPRHWAECLVVKDAGPGWWELLDRHRVNAVVVEPELHPALVKKLKADPGWVVVLGGDADPAGKQFVALRKQPK